MILTPLVLAALAIASIAISASLILSFAFNPLAIIGLVGIAAVTVFAVVLFTSMAIALIVLGSIYYFLRDVNEPFQRTPSKSYSLKQSTEVGKKPQNVQSKQENK